MGRLLFVLSLAGLGWWGYSTWFAGEVGIGGMAPAPRLGESPMLQAPEMGARDELEVAEGADVGEFGPPPPPAAGPQPLDASAQRPVAVNAAGPDALESLGTNNAFLHSLEGRKAGDQIIELAAGLPDERSLVMLTGLVELSMRGPITPGDTEARDFVNRAYAALLKPVKRHVFDPTNLTRARSYRVQRGDSLSLIARKLSRDHGLKLESGTLALVNRITNPNAIRAGQVLKAPMDPIRTVLEKRSFLMAVYLGPTIIRLYWVGHGEDDITPETEFIVVDKIEKPVWYHPDGRVLPYGHSENVLGDFFVKFSHASYTGFGAHGTAQKEAIGTMDSMGCIRMYDTDIREYFGFVPRGSTVVVRASH